MINTIELNVAIVRSGLTKRKIAESLGISDSSLQCKIKNKHEFKASEILKLRDSLGLSPEELNDIFFARA